MLTRAEILEIRERHWHRNLLEEPYRSLKLLVESHEEALDIIAGELPALALPVEMLCRRGCGQVKHRGNCPGQGPAVARGEEE